MDLLIKAQVQEQAQTGGDRLSEDRGQGGAGYAQSGKAAQAEDHDRIKNNIDNGAGGLGDHTVNGQACGLQQAFEGHLEEQPRGQTGHDPQIGGAHTDDFRVLCLGTDKSGGQEKTDQQEGQEIAEGQEKAVGRCRVGTVISLFSQGTGEEGVDTDTGTGAQGDHQVLQRKGQGNGGQSFFTETGYKDAVDYVVQGLYQHGDHHRQ